MGALPPLGFHAIPHSSSHMAIIEFVLLSTPPDLSVYKTGQSSSGFSVMQLRQRVADRLPMLDWDTDDFPLDGERSQLHSEILSVIQKLQSSNCESKLYYRVTRDDDREEISYPQLINLLKSEIDYDQQQHD